MIRTLLSLLVVTCFAVSQTPQALAGQAKAGVQSKAKSATAGPINLNTATAAELERLPGIGAQTAARVIEYRQKNGPFKKIEELMNVRGIGEKSFLKLRSSIVVAPAKTERATPQQ